MSENMIQPLDHHLPIDEITSPIGAQLFEFCESDLFPETVQNSEHASTSNNNKTNSYEEQSSYHADITKYPAADEINPSSPTAAAQTTSNFSIIFDDPTDHDISASIDFSSSPSFSAPQYYNNNHPTMTTTTTASTNDTTQEPFNISSLNNVMDMQLHQYERWPMVPSLPTSYEDDCLPSLPSYIRLRPSQPIMDPMIPPFCAPFASENPGIFTGMLGGDLPHQELDFQGDSTGLFLPTDNMSRVFNCSGELQALSSESQHLVHGGTSTTPLTSEISSLDDPTFKVGKLSVEERKRKIDRYMQKRNERNFSKKIKYACRKTLADSRPRVRGRFAKNDELGEIARNAGGNHDDDIDDDVSLFSNSVPDHQKKVGVKEEEDLESADIFAHISGVNSFKCNYPIQSWI